MNSTTVQKIQKLQKYLPFISFLGEKDSKEFEKYVKMGEWIEKKRILSDDVIAKCEGAIKTIYQKIKCQKRYVLPKSIQDIFSPSFIEITDSDSDCEIVEEKSSVTPSTTKSSIGNGATTSKTKKLRRRKRSKCQSKKNRELSDGEITSSSSSPSSLSSSSSSSSSSDECESRPAITTGKLPVLKSAGEEKRSPSPTFVKSSFPSNSSISPPKKRYEISEVEALIAISEESSSTPNDDDLCKRIDEVLDSDTAERDTTLFTAEKAVFKVSSDANIQKEDNPDVCAINSSNSESILSTVEENLSEQMNNKFVIDSKVKVDGSDPKKLSSKLNETSNRTKTTSENIESITTKNNNSICDNRYKSKSLSTEETVVTPSLAKTKTTANSVTVAKSIEMTSVGLINKKGEEKNKFSFSSLLQRLQKSDENISTGSGSIIETVPNNAKQNKDNEENFLFRRREKKQKEEILNFETDKNPDTIEGHETINKLFYRRNDQISNNIKMIDNDQSNQKNSVKSHKSDESKMQPQRPKSNSFETESDSHHRIEISTEKEVNECISSPPLSPLSIREKENSQSFNKEKKSSPAAKSSDDNDDFAILSVTKNNVTKKISKPPESIEIVSLLDSDEDPNEAPSSNNNNLHKDTQNVILSRNKPTNQLEDLELPELNDYKDVMISNFCNQNGVSKELLEEMLQKYCLDDAERKSESHNNFNNKTFTYNIESKIKNSPFSHNTFYRTDEIIKRQQEQEQQSMFTDQIQAPNIFCSVPLLQNQRNHHQTFLPTRQITANNTNNNSLDQLIRRTRDPRVKSLLKRIESSPIVPSDLRKFAAYTIQQNFNSQQQISQTQKPAKEVSSTCPQTYKEYRLQKEKIEAEKRASQLKANVGATAPPTSNQKVDSKSITSQKKSSPLKQKTIQRPSTPNPVASDKENVIKKPESTLTSCNQISTSNSNFHKNDAEKTTDLVNNAPEKPNTEKPTCSQRKERKNSICDRTKEQRKRRRISSSSSSSDGDVSKIKSLINYLPTKEIEKALDNVIPAIDRNKSPLTEETDMNAESFTKVARVLSNLQCTLNGAPNVLSMLSSPGGKKRHSSFVASQKIGKQLNQSSSNMSSTIIEAQKLQKSRRNSISVDLRNSCDVLSNNSIENRSEKPALQTAAAPIRRRRITYADSFKTSVISDIMNDVDRKSQLEKLNPNHNLRQKSTSQEEYEILARSKRSSSSSDTDQFDFEDYKWEKMKKEALNSETTVPLQRLSQAEYHKYMQKYLANRKDDSSTNSDEEHFICIRRSRRSSTLVSSSTNSQTFAKKSTSGKTTQSKSSKKILNNDPGMVYGETISCVICKSKPRGHLTEHYISRHDTESYVSRLSAEKLNELSENMRIVLPVASSGKTQKYKVTCGFCDDEIIDTFMNFYAHYSTHTGEYGFQCDPCGICKPFREDIMSHQRHDRRCRKGKVRPQYTYRSDSTVIFLYTCPHCNFVQLNEANIGKHIRDHHHPSLLNIGDEIQKLILAVIVDAPVTNETMEDDATANHPEYLATSENIDIQPLDIKDNILQQLLQEIEQDQERDKEEEVAGGVNANNESDLSQAATIKTELIHLSNDNTSATFNPPMTVIHAISANFNHTVSSENFKTSISHHRNEFSTKEPIVKMEETTTTSPSTAEPIPECSLDNTPSCSGLSVFKDSRTARTQYREYSSNMYYFGLFKCMAIDCAFSTDEKEQMMQHLSDHQASECPPQGYLECSYCCSQSTPDLDPESLIEHITEKHSTSRYQCPKCCYRSCLPGNVQIHRHLCHGEEKLTSDNIVYLCVGRETTVNDKIIYMQNEMMRNVKPLVCPEIICSKEFYAICFMEKHLMKFHKVETVLSDTIAKLTPWACIYCVENAFNRKNMQEHLAINHPDEYAFACERTLKSGLQKADDVRNLQLINISSTVLPKNIRGVERQEKKLSSPMRSLLKDRIILSGRNTGNYARSLHDQLSSKEENSCQKDQTDIISRTKYEDIPSLPQTNPSEMTTVDDNNSSKRIDHNQVSDQSIDIMEITDITEEDLILIEKADLKTLILKLTSNTGISPDVLYRCPLEQCNGIFSTYELWSKHVSLRHNLFIVACPHCPNKAELHIPEFDSHFKSHCRHTYICFVCGATSISEAECTVHFFENHENDMNSTDFSTEKLNFGGNYSYTVIRKKDEMSYLDVLRHLIDTIQMKLQIIEAQEAAKEMTRWPHQRQEWEDDFPSFCNYAKQVKKCMVQTCPFQTNDNEHLFGHVMSEHTVLGQSFNCSNCKFFLPQCENWQPVIDHVRLHLSDLFICCVCGCFTSSRANMTTHIQSSHNSREVIVVSLFRTEVRKYVSVDIVLAEKSIVPTMRECFCCKSDFVGKLTDHLNSEHSIRLDYSCEQCGERLPNSKDIANHHLSKHFDSLAFKLRCTLKTSSTDIRLTKVIPFTLEGSTINVATKRRMGDDQKDFIAEKKIKIENDVIIKDEIMDEDCIEIVDDEPEKKKITLKCVNINNLIDPNIMQTNENTLTNSSQPSYVNLPTCVPIRPAGIQKALHNLPQTVTGQFVPLSATSSSDLHPNITPIPELPRNNTPSSIPITISIPNINYSYTLNPSNGYNLNNQFSSSFPSSYTSYPQQMPNQQIPNRQLPMKKRKTAPREQNHRVLKELARHQ